MIYVNTAAGMHTRIQVYQNHNFIQEIDRKHLGSLR